MPRPFTHLLWFVLCFALGCGTSPHTVERWQLRLPGRADALPVTLPTHLDHVVPDRDLSYVLEADYPLPEALKGRDLDFVLPHFWGHTELWVDGSRAVRAETAPLYGHRATAAHVYRLPASTSTDGQVSLRLVVQHRWTHSAWFDVVPRLLPAGATDRATDLARFFNSTLPLIAAAWLFQLGVSALAIYFIGGRRRAYLWFGFQALLASTYPVFIHGETMHVLGRAEVPVVAIALIGTVWVSMRFSHEFFELGKVARRWDALCFAAVVVCLLGLDPYWCTALAGSATIVVVTLGVITQVRLGMRLMFDGRWRNDARWLVGCWLALALTTWSDMVMWAGFGEVFGGAHVACVGLAAFSFFLSLLLSQRHLSSLSRSDRLAAELEQRVCELERHGREIEQLNLELRRQIAERSEQIYAALALRERDEHPATALSPGDVVQSRYRVIALRGSGGMGAVYEVERLSDGTRLALKLARETHGRALALLAREAQIAAQLSLPNVVKIVDVDVASSGFLYLVMELVNGEPLHHHRRRFGDTSWALTVLRQVAAGLATLHRAGIVHRDVKPPNILVSLSDDPATLEVKITDFGIARFSPAIARALSHPPPAPEAPDGQATIPMPTAAPDDGTRREGSMPSRPAPSLLASDTGLITRSGQVAGTPLYMAPELVKRGVKATAKADIYSLGVLAWELLAKRRPSLRPAATAVLAGEVPEPVPSLAPLAQDLPLGVAHAVDACLSLDPEARPSAEELEALFAQALA